MLKMEQKIEKLKSDVSECLRKERTQLYDGLP